MARRLAKVLQIPVAYLYCDDDQLADVIARYGALSVERQGDLLAWLATEMNTDKPISPEPVK